MTAGLVTVLVLPLVVSVAGALAGGELKGWFLRSARAEVDAAVGRLPEPEATIRREEWARHLEDLRREPIHAYLYGKRIHREAVELAAELTVLGEGVTRQMSVALDKRERTISSRDAVGRELPVKLAAWLRMSKPKLADLARALAPTSWGDVARQVSLFVGSFLIYGVVRYVLVRDSPVLTWLWREVVLLGLVAGCLLTVAIALWIRRRRARPVAKASAPQTLTPITRVEAKRTRRE